jgi:hypothetical protein
MALDAKRRMVIVRMDDTEHLLLLGQTSEQIVGGGENAAQAPAQPQAQPILHAIDTRREAAG